MHFSANGQQDCCTVYGVTSRRRRRQAAAQRRHAKSTQDSARASGLKLADDVERLVYTREHAAEALGISLATLDRRVVPVIATVETEWGRRLIPVSELERYLAERTKQPRAERRPAKRAGRKASVPPELVQRIRAEHASGRSLGQIARDLNAEEVTTAQGGRQWWPSTVRSVLVCLSRPESSQSNAGSPRGRQT
jgi:Recombinase